jgi:hypothetical protein
MGEILQADCYYLRLPYSLSVAFFLDVPDPTRVEMILNDPRSGLLTNTLVRGDTRLSTTTYPKRYHFAGERREGEAKETPDTTWALRVKSNERANSVHQSKDWTHETDARAREKRLTDSGLLKA